MESNDKDANVRIDVLERAKRIAEINLEK